MPMFHLVYPFDSPVGKTCDCPPRVTWDTQFSHFRITKVSIVICLCSSKKPDGVEGGRETQEGGAMCIPVADSYLDVWQKLTQYYKEIIFQLKIKKIKQTKKNPVSSLPEENPKSPLYFVPLL